MLRSRLVFGLAIIAAGICAATGVRYATSIDLRLEPEDGNPASFLASLAFLGAAGLAATGWWQLRAVGRTRVGVLVLLATLAGAYVAANMLALDVTWAAGQSFPGVFHTAGLWAGVVLYGAALVETTFAVIEDRRTEEAASPA